MQNAWDTQFQGYPHILKCTVSNGTDTFCSCRLWLLLLLLSSIPERFDRWAQNVPCALQFLFIYQQYLCLICKTEQMWNYVLTLWNQNWVPIVLCKDQGFKWPPITLRVLGRQLQWMFIYLIVTLDINSQHQEVKTLQGHDICHRVSL